MIRNCFKFITFETIVFFTTYIASIGNYSLDQAVIASGDWRLVK